MQLSNDQKWMLVSAGSAVVAAGAVRLLLRQGWERATGHEPPKNPATPEVEWKDALAWGIGTGVAASVARVLAVRAAARSWSRLQGSHPRALRRQRPGA